MSKDSELYKRWDSYLKSQEDHIDEVEEDILEVLENQRPDFTQQNNDEIIKLYRKINLSKSIIP